MDGQLRALSCSLLPTDCNSGKSLTIPSTCITATFCTVLLRHFLSHSLPFQNPVFFCHHIILTVLLLPLIPLDQLGIQRGLLHLQPLHLRGLLLQQLL